MLALLFRGVFLVGVIGWYSASLWRTVDSYFKSQFQRYLDEEYARNPRMRDDVRAYTTAADKTASDLIAVATCSGVDDDVCPIDKADLAREVKSHNDESVPPQRIDSGATGAAAAAEIEVARPTTAQQQHTDRPAFRDSPVVDEAEPPPAELHEEIMPPPAIRDHRSDESSNPGGIKRPAEKAMVPKQKHREQKAKEAEPKKEENQSSPRARKGARAKKRPKIVAKPPTPTQTAKPKSGKKRDKIPTLKLTDNDFREFDSEDGFVDNFADDVEEDLNGIPLKDLPFKPMIDVYDLERVSEEEFCPLSLDDDPTCDELRSWP